MKTFISYFIFLIFISALHAQTVSLFPADTSIHLNNVDISDEFAEFSNQIQIKNETSDTLSIIWRKIIPADCPFSWKFFIGDINITYVPWIYSNYDPNLGIDFPFQLLPNQTTMGSFIGLRPESTEGCCQFSIEYSEASNPDSILATANIDYRINDPECTLVSIEEQASNSLKVFPNPAAQEIFIESAAEIKSIELFDLNGSLIKSFINPPYLIEELAAGLYFLKIEERSGIDHFVKFNKI